MRLRLAAALLPAALLGVGPSPCPAAAAEPSGGELVAAWNRRDIGGSGVRRLRLDLHNAGEVVRSFETVHAWQRQGRAVRSLVLLERPEGLRGTSYLLREDPELELGFQVHLHLAAGQRRVLAVQPSRFDEGLLGSDFGYSDLLWEIPTVGRELELVGAAELDGVPTWVVEATVTDDRVAASTRWRRVRYHLRREPLLLEAVEYYPRDGTGVDPAKRLRLNGWERRDGVWTPTRMVMRVDAERQSVMLLRSARFHLEPFPPATFEPAGLRRHAAALEAGETPDFLRRERE